MLSVKKVVNSKLCIGCGLCSVETQTGEIKFSKKNDCFIPSNTNIPNDSIANKICPGKGYNILESGKKLFPDSKQYDIDLGYIHSISAVRSTNTSILRDASSGGIITSLLLYLLQEKIVDKVSVTKFICTTSGVSTKTFLTSNIEEILAAQGSKYCPVNYAHLINELKHYKGRVAIVATPCVIAGIRSIEENQPDCFRSKIKFTIANFCGGFKSYTNIKKLAKVHKVDYKNLKDFRFRGGGQPGSLRFISNDGQVAETPYPQYVGFTGQSKMLRCHLCVDATGELADISCGDAWIPRFEEDQHPWSVVLTRSARGKSLLKNMKEKNHVVLEQMSIEEVKLSQRFNLKSKKIRQTARMRLYKLLGYRRPSFDGGFSEIDTGLSTEIQVYFKHQFKLILDKLGLYKTIYSCSKKI